MARRRLSDINVRKISRVGNGSYAITIPIEYVRKLKWQNKQKVVVELDEEQKQMTISDWPSHRATK